MKIYLLTAENLRNASFIKDFAFYFKPKGKAVLLHDAFGSEADTRFVSKRLSAYLSEELVVNAILNGDQRNLISESDQGITVRQDLIELAFKQVDLVVMNVLMEKDGSVHLANLEAVLKGLRAFYPTAALTMFPSNPRSALGQTGVKIGNATAIKSLLNVYDEEAPLLEKAARMAPVMLVNPAAFQAQP